MHSHTGLDYNQGSGNIIWNQENVVSVSCTALRPTRTSTTLEQGKATVRDQQLLHVGLHLITNWKHALYMKTNLTFTEVLLFL